MPQFERPSADVAYINWGNTTGAPVDLFAEINEASPDDNSFVQTIVAAPVNEHYVTKLSGLSDPVSDDGHVLRVRFRKSPPDGAPLDYLVELRQGYVDEALQGELIDAFPITDVFGTFETYELPVAPSNAMNITDYGDLYVRIVANQP